jgi:nitroreductase
MSAQGAPLPEYVQREFEEYLRCGRLEHGFLRVRCESCHAEHLVAFSWPLLRIPAPAAFVIPFTSQGLLQNGRDDQRKRLARAAQSQSWVEEAAAAVVFAAVYESTMRKYGERGVRYVHMEVGHAAQNLFLQAVALRLATVVVGAFDDDEVARVLQLPANAHPLLLMPVGRP